VRGEATRLFAALISSLVLFVMPGVGQHWPRERHDGQLTGRAVTTGLTPFVAGPQVASVELGGTAGDGVLGDVDGDGARDVAFLRGGHVVVVDAGGRTVFDRFVGATDLVAAQDLDGDARAEVVFVNRDTRTLGVADIARQAVRWRFVFPDGVTLLATYVRLADVSPTRPGVETVVFADHVHTTGDAFGYFFDANGTLYARPVVKELNGGQLNFPQTAIADVVPGGDLEVVVVGRPRLMVFSAGGGLLRELDFRAGDAEGRHYGTLLLANVDADPEPEAVVVADRMPVEIAGKTHAITVFDLAPTIRELWRVVLPNAERFEAVLNGVRDFDGDGRDDLAVNRFDGATQRVEIYRGAGDPAQPGRPQLLASRQGAFLWDVWDADGDGRHELFTSVTQLQSPTLSYNSDLAIYRAEHAADALRLEPVGDPLTKVRYATRPPRTHGGIPLDVGFSSDERSVLVTAVVAGDPVFLTYSKAAGADPSYQFRGVAERRTKVVDGGLRPGVVRSVVGPDLFLVAEGAGEEASDTMGFFRWNAQRSKLVREAAFKAGTFDADPPLVADLDGDGRAELLTRMPGRRIGAFAYDPAAKKFSMLWEAGGNVMPVVDVGTRPRETRVFVVAPDKQDRAMLVARDGNGTIVWKHKFDEVPANAKPQLVIGEFTGSPPRDVWVSVARTRSWMLDGATGSVVWQSPVLSHFSNRTAVTDRNGDGVDDLVLVTNDVYGVYSGRDGRALVGPFPIRSLGGDLHATPIVAPDGTMLLVSRGTLAKATVAGKKVWSVARGVDRTEDSLLVGVAAADGRIQRVGGNFGPGDQFVAYDYADGKVAFTTPYVAITDVNTADTDGDGVDEFVFGTADGRVVALRSDTGREVWNVDVNGFMSAPVIADLGGGAISVIVPVGDGTIRVYGR
jgi:outer membrane protein assembly factor BamB